MIFPRWFLYAVEVPKRKIPTISFVVEIPGKGKIPVVSRQRSVPVAVIADACHFHFHFLTSCSLLV